MHLGAAERLVVGLLAGRHLHQRRAAEEHLGLLAHHHGVVGHPGHVGAARGGVAEDQRDRSGRLAADERVMSRKSLPPGMKISFCVGRSAPPDSTSATVGRRFSSAICEARKIFLTVHGLLAPPFTVGSLAVIMHSTPSMTPIPVTTRGADGEVRAPAGQRRQLEERAARVDEQLDALAGQQLAAGVVALDVPLPAAGDGHRVLGVEVGDLLQHRGSRFAAHASTTAFIRSSVVRIPRTLVRERSGPRTSQ